MNPTTATPENDRSEWSRYQIRVILEADCKTLGAIVAAADSPQEAKIMASSLGSAQYHGVAIVDIEDGIVDAGECDGEKLIFDLDKCVVRA